jgi:hypothetical protein
MTNRANHIPGFEKIRIKSWTLYVNKDFPATSVGDVPGLSELVSGVRGPFDEVRSSRFARVFRCSVGFAGRCYNLYIKQYLYRSVWDFVKHLFRRSRAERSFKASAMLAEHGFCVPEMIAMGRRKYGPFCTANFLITRQIEDAKAIHTFLPEEGKAQSTASVRDRRRLIKALGQTIGRMHAAGIFHGDLRAGNVFAKKTKSRWQFFFLDNERTKRYHHLPDRLRLKNLVQINMLRAECISDTDRMRFFKSYLLENPEINKDVKRWERKVAYKTDYRLRDQNLIV